MDEKIEKFKSWYDPQKKYNLKVTDDEFHMKVKKVGSMSRIWTKAQEVVINQIQSDIRELKSDVAELKIAVAELKADMKRVIQMLEQIIACPTIQREIKQK